MRSSILIDRHRQAGALLSSGEPPLLLSYGEVPAEYRAGCESAALFDRSDRGSIDVIGGEAASFLHRLLANSVRTLKPGEGNRNLLLSSRGKVLALFELELSVDRVRLSTHPGQARGLLGALDTYLFAEKIKLVDRSEESAPLELAGPKAREIAERLLGRSLPDAEHAWIEHDFHGATLRASPMIVAGSPGVRLDAGPAAAEKLWDALIALGATPAGIAAQDCLRAEACWAEPGADIDENVYPQEARLERAFSLSKGCYIGQEVVAKIDTYGGLNKRLCVLRVEHSDPVARGTPLVRVEEGERRELGLVTSWAYSFAHDTGLVLAYVKRRHQEPGTEFELGAGPARARLLPRPS